MKAEEQKILNESLSKLFKLDQETLASLYNEAGDLIDFSKILDLDVERVRKSKSESDSQYKRGIKEGASKIEKEVKEKYHIESESVGIDLIDQLVVKQIEDAKIAGTKDITKHQDYIKLQLEHEKEKKSLAKEWQDKLDARDKEVAKAALFEKVSKKALASLEIRKPILPQDPRKAQVWKDTYLNDLKSGKYQEDGDNIIVLDAEGAILKNAHGHTVTFEEYEKEIADKYFEYPKAEERSSSGNKEEKKSDNGTWIAPKNDDEYMKRLKDPKIIPEERIKLVNWFNQKG